MRIRDFIFPAVMCLLTVATVHRYRSVRHFIDQSREYVFVVEADGNQVPRIKSDLEGATFQRVDGELMEDGRYKFTVRCPPEKVGLMWSMLGKFSERRALD